MSARDRLLATLSPEQFVAAVEQLVTERVQAELDARDAARPNGRAWLTLEEAGEKLGCSADAVRMRVRRGRLDSRRQGRRLYVSAASLERLA